MNDKPMMGLVVPCHGGGMSEEQILAIRKIQQAAAIDPPPTELRLPRFTYRYTGGNVEVDRDGVDVLDIERGDLVEVITFLQHCARENRTYGYLGRSRP